MRSIIIDIANLWANMWTIQRDWTRLGRARCDRKSIYLLGLGLELEFELLGYHWLKSWDVWLGNPWRMIENNIENQGFPVWSLNCCSLQLPPIQSDHLLNGRERISIRRGRKGNNLFSMCFPLLNTHLEFVFFKLIVASSAGGGIECFNLNDDDDSFVDRYHFQWSSWWWWWWLYLVAAV